MEPRSHSVIVAAVMDACTALAIVQAIIACREACMDVYGTPIGLNLVEAFYRDSCLSAQDLAQYARLSEDTARRELTRLVDRGLVMTESRGRLRLYRSKEAPAAEYIRRAAAVWTRLAADLA